MHVIHNGQILPAAEAKIGLTEPGVLYGEGCFETLRLHAGQPRFFAQHWARLADSAQALGLPLAVDESTAESLLMELAVKNGVSEGIGRISLHQTEADADIFIQSTPPRRWPLPESFRVTISDWPHPGPSPLSGIKHNNYALFRAAHQQARTDGWDECLLANHRGEIIEGGISNVFWVDEAGNLATPPCPSGALPGIIRGRIMALYSEIIERTPSRDALMQAREVFLTNSFFEIMPVGELNGQKLALPGHITSGVQAAFSKAHPLS